MTLRFLRHGALVAGLLTPLLPVRAVEEEVLPFNAAWEWLMILEPNSAIQVDPASLDPDFLETWTTPAYDGPEFQPGIAPLSYGGLEYLMSGSAPPGTMLPAPAPGSRFTVYCRTTLDLRGELTNAQLEFLADDGFILYVDGVRWVAWNMAAGATSAFNEITTIVGNEAALFSTTAGSALPALSAGRHTLHLSLHNANPISSDLGFMLRIVGDLRLVPFLTAEVTAPSLEGTPRVLLQAKNLDPAEAFIVQASTDCSEWLPLFESPAAPERTAFSINIPAPPGRRFFRLAK